MGAGWRAWKWTVLTASKNAVTDLSWCKVELTAPHVVKDGTSGLTCVSLPVQKSLCPCPLILPLGITGRVCLHLSSPIRYLYTAIRFPHSLLFSGLSSHSALSPSLPDRCCNPLIIFRALCLACSSTSMFCTGTPRTGHSSPGLDHLPGPVGNALRNAAQDVFGIFGMRPHCWLTVSLLCTRTLRPFSAELFSSGLIISDHHAV